MRIVVWPDNFWCEESELETCGHARSDDFVRLTVPDHVTDIEAYVNSLNRPQREYRWKLVKEVLGCHRIFFDDLTGFYAIGDQSGALPHLTHDGVLWIDRRKPVVNNHGKWSVPLWTAERKATSSLVGEEEAVWLIQNLQMSVRVGDRLTLKAEKTVRKIPKKDGVGDVSTMHITLGDATKLNLETDLPGRIGAFEYGYVVLTHAETNSVRRTALAERGMSEAYIKLLEHAHAQGFHYLMIDQDGPVIEGLERFDW